ncbi:MAG TPA: SigB/SigF/SigG family RNA polymerase sigma factor [Thermoleophilaceae bacterium]|nr:SigB/SigF/SigG family RNA polymerase sigma factor [Thermoleophilaceae bacterium]
MTVEQLAPERDHAISAAIWIHQAGERNLFLRYRRFGDQQARDELVRRNIDLAHRLARRYRQDGMIDDDLRQVAMLALLKAIDRYDPERGTKFSSLAVPTILGEIKRHFRDHGWGVHVPRGLQEQALAVSRALEDLTAELGRAPTAAELALRMHLPVEEVLEALEAGAARQPDRLDAPGSLEDGGAVLENVGRDDPALQRAEVRRDLSRALAVLGERDRELLALRFLEDRTQSEIAALMGISQMHVSRLLRQALEHAHGVLAGG